MLRNFNRLSRLLKNVKLKPSSVQVNHRIEGKQRNDKVTIEDSIKVTERDQYVLNPNGIWIKEAYMRPYSRTSSSSNQLSTSVFITLLAAGAGFLFTLRLNAAQQNKDLLYKEIYEECKEAIDTNNTILLETKVDCCETRLLFYNQNHETDISEHQKQERHLRTQLMKNKLLQDRLMDLITSAKFFCGPPIIEQGTVERAENLLSQQRRQYYRLTLAYSMNLAIMLHKQGRYEEALMEIIKIKKIIPISTSYNPPIVATKDARYWPRDKVICTNSFFVPSLFSEKNINSNSDNAIPLDIQEIVESSPFVRGIFTNTYNVEGMIYRSLSLQASNPALSNKPKQQAALTRKCFLDVTSDKLLEFIQENCPTLTRKQLLEFTEQSLVNALEIEVNNPVILSNLGFLFNKMAKEQGKLLKNALLPQTELDDIQHTINQHNQKAFEYHEKAYKSKRKDENDVAVFNGLAYGITMLKDSTRYQEALALFDRALKITIFSTEHPRYYHDILENKAELLLLMANDKKAQCAGYVPFSVRECLAQARECIDQAIEVSDEHSDACDLGAQIADAQGDQCGMKAYLQKKKQNELGYPEQLTWHSDIANQSTNNVLPFASP